MAKHVKKRKEEVNKQRDFVNQLRGPFSSSFLLYSVIVGTITSFGDG